MPHVPLGVQIQVALAVEESHDSSPTVHTWIPTQDAVIPEKMTTAHSGVATALSDGRATVHKPRRRRRHRADDGSDCRPPMLQTHPAQPSLRT